MRVRLIILGLCLGWIAVESRFSPEFFWASVRANLASAMTSLHAGLDRPEGAAPILAANGAE